MLPKKPVRLYAIFILILILLVGGGYLGSQILHARQEVKAFDGQRAMQDVETQIAMGARIPGSQAHQQLIDWLGSQLDKAGWTMEVQSSEMMGHPVKNLVARRKEVDLSQKPWIVLGAHYDSRLWANRDPDPNKQKDPVPGANDGATGVAVLLELARTLPANLHAQVWLVFFDAEDNGEIPGWDWLLGSQAFVQNLKSQPDSAIIIDMIGDKDLNINIERNSNQKLVAEIWAKAAELGYTQFKPVPKYSMIDDHTPFLQAGIPAVDIIDFDYPYWHTTEDTPDKVSAQSMEAVGKTLTAWLESK